MSRRHRRPLIVLAFLIGTGCGDLTVDDASVGAAVAETGYTIASTSFWLDTDASGTEPRPDGPGFIVTNDLGHRLEITEAWLAFSAMSLAACSTSVTARSSPSVGQALASVSDHLIGGAHAGHGDDYGPASIIRPLVEDLTGRGAMHLGDAAFDPLLLCRAHYVAGTAPDTAEGLAQATTMSGRTLLVRGWATRDEGDGRVGFELHTDLNHGRLVELKELMGVGGGEAIRLTVTRHLGTMFDGVDVVVDDDPGQAVLWNLIGDATLSVRPDDD